MEITERIFKSRSMADEAFMSERARLMLDIGNYILAVVIVAILAGAITGFIPLASFGYLGLGILVSACVAMHFGANASEEVTKMNNVGMIG